MYDKLKSLVESGIIDAKQLNDAYEIMKRRTILEQHPYDIW